MGLLAQSPGGPTVLERKRLGGYTAFIALVARGIGPGVSTTSPERGESRGSEASIATLPPFVVYWTDPVIRRRMCA